MSGACGGGEEHGPTGMSGDRLAGRDPIMEATVAAPPRMVGGGAACGRRVRARVLRRSHEVI